MASVPMTKQPEPAIDVVWRYKVLSRQMVPSLLMTNKPALLVELMAEVSATNDGLPEPCVKRMRPELFQVPTEVTVNGVAGATKPKAEPKNMSPVLTKSPTDAKS